MNIIKHKGRSYVERRCENVERDAEIVQLRVKKYWTYNQLVDKYGVSRQRIYQILQENDAVISREGMLDKLSEHAYKFILEYKEENDGNTPSIRTIVLECPHMFDLARAKRAIQHLEETGKVVIDKNSPLRIRVIGAKWVAPTGYQEE